jgi:hypothetical protein
MGRSHWIVIMENCDTEPLRLQLTKAACNMYLYIKDLHQITQMALEEIT